MLRVLLAAGVLALAGCAPLPAADRPQILLLGEQHDALAHPHLHQQVVEDLAAAGQLAALVLEMAEEGRSTRGLPRDAAAAQVRTALAWDGWPWERYEPAVMGAVRAGVPVAGANVPRPRLREARNDETLDVVAGRQVMRAQAEAVQTGHCGLLPEAQLTPMARMQVARDVNMARVAASFTAPGKTVVLITGARHADPAIGIPVHLPASLRAQARIWPPEPAKEDHCAKLRQLWENRPRPGPS